MGDGVGASSSRFDALCAAPFEQFAVLRRESPVHHVAGMPLVLLTRHEDCVTALAAPTVFRNSREGLEKSFEAIGFAPTDREVCSILDAAPPAPPMLVHTDPPTHTAHRRMIASWFSPRQVEARWVPVIEGHVDRLIHSFRADGSVEFIDALAAPLPSLVMCDILGLPTDRWRDFKRWSDDSVAPLGRSLDRAAWEAHARSAGEMGVLLIEIVRQRRAAPRDDLVSALAAHLDAAHDDDRLTETQITSVLAQLIAAGNETTTQLLGGAMALFAEQPNTWRHLCADPSSIPAAVEEALRVVSPVRGLFKTVHHDTELRGTPIAAGSVVGVMFGAANHDDSVFADPTVFRIDRGNTSQHLALGRGIHFCLGAPLARAEARVALARLTSRYSGVRLRAGAAPRHGAASFMLGNLVELPLSFSNDPGACQP